MAAAGPAGAGNPFTTKYGALQGWQWVAVGGVAFTVLLYYRSRKAASTAAPNSAGQGLDAAGNPIPGSQVLAPIILQQGAGSTGPAGKDAPPRLPSAAELPKFISGQSAIGKTMVMVAPGGVKPGLGIPTYIWSASQKGFAQSSKLDTGHTAFYVPVEWASYVTPAKAAK